MWHFSQSKSGLVNWLLKFMELDTTRPKEAITRNVLVSGHPYDYTCTAYDNIYAVFVCIISSAVVTVV